MRRPRVVCLGEVALDLIEVRRNRTDVPVFEAHVGGSPVNVAAAVRHLGGDVRIWSAIGTDPAGDEATRQLGRLGLSTDAISRIKGRPTRLMFLERGRDGSRSLRPMPGATADQFLDPVLRPDLTQCDLLYVSGAALIGDQSAEHAQRAIREVRANGGLAAIDPNIRVGSSAAGHRIQERIRAAAAMCDLLQYGHDRAGEYWDNADPPSTLLTIETRGASGAMIRTAEQSVMIDAQRKHAVDPTGAGDAFFAVIMLAVASLSRAERHSIQSDWMRAQGKRAAELAATVVSRIGATTAFLNTEVEPPS